ncbi:MAG: EAL domain-containing protein, partial [Cyanobacteriota bacterium]
MDVSLSEIIDQIPGIVDLYDVAGDRILWANASFRRITGYTVKKANQLGALGLVFPDDRDLVLDAMLALLTDRPNAIQHFEYRITTKSRQVRWLSSHKSVVIIGDRRTVLGISIDCTQQKNVHHESLAGIRAGLSRDEFRLYGQPIVSLESGAIAGIELLTRWHQANGSVVKPGEFMPLIEKESGTSKRFCLYVLSRVDQALARHPDLFIAVNVSPILLEQPGLFEFITSIISPAQAH